MDYWSPRGTIACRSEHILALITLYQASCRSISECTILIYLHNYKSTKAAAIPPTNPTPLPPTTFIIAAAELVDEGAAFVGDDSVGVVGAGVVAPPPVVVAVSDPDCVAAPPPPVVAPVAVGDADPLVAVELQTTSSGTSTGGLAVVQMFFA